MFLSFLMDKNMLKDGINGDALETSDFFGSSVLFLRGTSFTLSPIPINQEFPCFLFHDWAVNLLFKMFSTKG